MGLGGEGGGSVGGWAKGTGWHARARRPTLAARPSLPATHSPPQHTHPDAPLARLIQQVVQPPEHSFVVLPWRGLQRVAHGHAVRPDAHQGEAVRLWVGGSERGGCWGAAAAACCPPTRSPPPPHTPTRLPAHHHLPSPCTTRPHTHTHSRGPAAVARVQGRWCWGVARRQTAAAPRRRPPLPPTGSTLWVGWPTEARQGLVHVGAAAPLHPPRSRAHPPSTHGGS